MKKRLIGSLLFGALIAASTGTFVSCTNYDDDFAELRNEIKAQQDLIAQLQDKVKNGDVIESVTPISGGILVTLSDGSTYSIVNGKDGLNGVDGLNGQDGRDGRDGKDGQDGKNGVDGQNGTVWEIDAETGYWKKDGVLTEFKAVGTDGTSAVTPTIDIVDGYWVINGQNTGVKAVGQDGRDGVDGQNGQDGRDGRDGVDGQNGQDGRDGVDGQNGQDGRDGKDGKDGLTPTVEINAEGYWVINGVTSNVKAQGRDGQDGLNGRDGQDGLPGLTGDAGQNGQNGYYYVPNTETGCFDIYMDGVRVAVTEIPYMATGSVTAVLDQQNLSVYGLTAGDVQVCLAGYLRSLVFKPMLYLDGIETIEYKWLQDTTMIKTGAYNNTNRQGKVVRGLNDYVANYLPAENGFAPKASLPGSYVFNYGPAWGVDYHMNPANADVDYADVVGYNVLEPSVLYVKTRANASALGVSSPEKNAAGAKIFKTSNGYVTAGLQIAHPELLNEYPTDLTDNKGDNTIALQISSKTSDGKKDPITSDYALLKGTKHWLEALVWTKKPTYFAGSDKNRKGDQKGIYGNGQYGLFTTTAAHIDEKVHVWDSPEGALNDPDGAALELLYNAADGITLSNYLGIHMVHAALPSRGFKVETLGFGAEKVWGLSYEFELVDYSVDGNVTHDSKYADWGKIGASKEEIAASKAIGQLVARNVKEDGVTIDTESATAVDREPLVRVLVKNIKGDVVLDGYILIHITRNAAAVATPDNKLVDNYPAQSAQFEICNGKVIFKTNWSQFSYYVLTEKLENMTKEDFDANYEADLLATNIGTTADGGEIDQLNIFKAFKKNGNESPSNDLGIAKYYPNWEGTTNHTFEWELTAEEFEQLTHDKATYPVEITRYIRFKEKADAPNAKYPYIYVKMTVSLTRKDIGAITFAQKNDNYWFGLDGADGGWDAIVFDVKEPTDGGDIIQINREIRSTLLGNMEKINDTHKYFFVPKPVAIKALNGKTYTITAQSGPSDVKWNHLYCKYLPAVDMHLYDEAKLDEILTNCAIDYNLGAFTNDKLYAAYNGTYTQIATLDQATGEIALINNIPCEDVLNAVGFAENHANISTEMRTWVNVVAKNNCDVAKKTNHEKTDLKSFLVSWQRPINMKDLGNQVMVDAKTNGNIIYVLDFLKLFDWRGEPKGYMWGDQQWFWAYYNVKYIKVNTNPSVVTTNMHYGGNTFKKLSEITTKAELYSYPSMNKGEDTYNFSLTPTYDFAAQNGALLKYMGISPADASKKEKFGAIAYYNNGDNVEEFDIRVPITIGYEWGEFTQTVQITIKRTIQGEIQ